MFPSIWDINIYKMRESELASGKKKTGKQDTALPSGSAPPGMQRGGANFVNVLKSTAAEATGQLGSWARVATSGEIWR